MIRRPSDTIVRVLLLYTGGTIGMENTPEGYKPKKGYMTGFLRKNALFHDPVFDYPPFLDHDFLVTPKFGHRIAYKVVEFEPLLDSSNMTMTNWAEIAQSIGENYSSFDSFVVIHGTDTMSFTASALSFMLENLRKTVVITGSQVPLTEQMNDGQDNLLGAILIAGHFLIPEVCLYFDYHLYRGNRSSKVDASDFHAFNSPNLPPLISIGVDFEVSWQLILPMPLPGAMFRVASNPCRDVGVLQLFPGLTTDVVASFLNSGIKGVVLKTYGSGDGPMHNPQMLKLCREAHQRQILIVNCPRCIYASPSSATEHPLEDYGVIFGHDITVEACLAKLSYVLSQPISFAEMRELMKKPLKGELSDQVSSSNLNQGISHAVASLLSANSKREIEMVDTTLNVAMMCTASALPSQISTSLFQHLSRVSMPDTSKKDSLTDQERRLVRYDTSLRAPIHVAALNANTLVTKHLLETGLNRIDARDADLRTPLYYAIKGRSEECVLALKTGGLGAISKKEIASELCIAAAGDDVELLRCWVAAETYMNVQDYCGATCLHVAIRRRQLAATRYLVRLPGIDMDIPDQAGVTAAMLLKKDLEFAALVKS